MSVAAMHTVGSCSAYSEEAHNTNNGSNGSCHDYRKAKKEPSTVAVVATQRDYQGRGAAAVALPAFDLRALDAGGPNNDEAEHLLAAVLDAYWKGEVTQAKAAKLIGIRRKWFVELAEIKLVDRVISDDRLLRAAAWRIFLSAFHECFPECDSRIRAQGPLPGMETKTDDLWRPPPIAPCIHIENGTD